MPITRTPSVSPPLEEAETIPASWYHDPDTYRLELDRVFRRTWQCAGRVDQVSEPGSYFTCTVGDEPIVVVRGEDGVVRAFYNVCRHRAGDPARGSGKCRAFSCHYHGWTYALDGRLLAAPEMDGVRSFEKRDFSLVPVRAEVWEPLVFVNLDPQAPSLAESLGDMIEQTKPYRLESLAFADRVEYVIACNWKVYVDNFLEGYHVPRAHPGLNRVLDYKRYVVEPRGRYVVQYGPNRDADAGSNPLVAFKKSAKPRAGFAGEVALGSKYLWLFPAFMWNLSPDVAQTNLIVPLGPEKTLTIFDFFYDREAETSAEIRRGNVDYSDEIQREDIEICETVQRNLHSRSYDRGRYSAKRENGVYHFHCLLREALGRS
jgi:choline monooxygenase